MAFRAFVGRFDTPKTQSSRSACLLFRNEMTSGTARVMVSIYTRRRHRCVHQWLEQLASPLELPERASWRQSQPSTKEFLSDNLRYSDRFAKSREHIAWLQTWFSVCMSSAPAGAPVTGRWTCRQRRGRRASRRAPVAVKPRRDTKPFNPPHPVSRIAPTDRSLHRTNEPWMPETRATPRRRCRCLARCYR